MSISTPLFIKKVSILCKFDKYCPTGVNGLPAKKTGREGFSGFVLQAGCPICCTRFGTDKSCWGQGRGRLARDTVRHITLIQAQRNCTLMSRARRPRPREDARHQNKKEVTTNLTRYFARLDAPFCKIGRAILQNWTNYFADMKIGFVTLCFSARCNRRSIIV